MNWSVQVDWVNCENKERIEANHYKKLAPEWKLNVVRWDSQFDLYC